MSKKKAKFVKRNPSHEQQMLMADCAWIVLLVNTLLVECTKFSFDKASLPLIGLALLMLLTKDKRPEQWGWDYVAGQAVIAFVFSGVLMHRSGMTWAFVLWIAETILWCIVLAVQIKNKRK